MQMSEEKYNNNMATIYDLIHEDKDYKSEVDYIEHIYRSIDSDKKEVLDVGCGNELVSFW